MVEDFRWRKSVRREIGPNSRLLSHLSIYQGFQINRFASMLHIGMRSQSGRDNVIDGGVENQPHVSSHDFEIVC